MMKVVLGPEWKKLEQMLGDGVLRQRLDNARDETLSRASAESVDTIKAQFGSRKMTRNAPLTIGIKQSDSPLIDTGGVKDAVMAVQPKPEVVWVGVPRGASRKRHWIKAMSAFDAAVQIHNGKSIRITDKMRNLFMALYLVRMGKMDPSSLTGRAAELYARGPADWRPLSKSKKVIRIPKRPFLAHALYRSGLKRRCRVIFRDAVKRHLNPTVNAPSVRHAIGGKP